MAHVLVISSQVARGHVGLSAMVPALQQLGHEVWALPTIVLSNHPRHSHVAGSRIDPTVLLRMLDALDANGWLGTLNAVVTGYLPSTAHVAAARRIVDRLREINAAIPYLCDPVLGDDDAGVYIDVAAAREIRDHLLPLATIATPNRFELGWLTGRQLATLPEALAAARALGPSTVVATSLAHRPGELVTAAIGADRAFGCAVARRARAPHGTGDLLAGLYIGHLLGGRSAELALGLAVAGVEAALIRSADRDELALATCPEAWSAPAPLAVEELR